MKKYFSGQIVAVILFAGSVYKARGKDDALTTGELTCGELLRGCSMHRQDNRTLSFSFFGQKSNPFHMRSEEFWLISDEPACVLSWACRLDTLRPFR